MRASTFFLLNCIFMILCGCSNKPKELLAPCSWDHRRDCGSIIAISHQDQL